MGPLLSTPDLTRRQFIAASALSAVGMASRAEAAPWRPQPESMDLFTARVGGYTHYRIPGIVIAPDGALLAYCEARRDARGDWGDIDILLRRSVDGGRTWSPPRLLVDVQETIINPAAEAQNLTGSGTAANNPVAIPDARTGAVHFLYCAAYARCYAMRSDDGGQSFSQPVDITAVLEGYREEYPWVVVATGPGHGIQLSSGRLLVPIWMSTGEGGHAHRPSVAATLYSDDHGGTWQRGAIAAVHGELYPTEAGGRASVTTIVNPSETVAVELGDGRVMLNIRSESPESRRAQVVSADGSGGWSPPAFHPDLYEPVCMGSLVRLPGATAAGRARLVFVNPDSRHVPKRYGSASGSRENLTVRLSRDDGTTWPAKRVLDPGIAGYSDIAAGADGSLYCFYERGRLEDEQGATFAALTLTRFDVDWLADPAAALSRR